MPQTITFPSTHIPPMGYQAPAISGDMSLDEYIASLNPILDYRMNETSGTTAINYGSAGASVNASYLNGVLLNQVGLVGAAAQFDGVDDRLSIPNHSSWANLDVLEWMLVHRITHTLPEVLGHIGGASGSGYDFGSGASFSTTAIRQRMFNTSNTNFQTLSKHILPTNAWIVTNFKFNNLTDRKSNIHINGVEMPQYATQPALTGTMRKPVNPMPIFSRESDGLAVVGGLLNRVVLFDSERTPTQRQTVTQLYGLTVPTITRQVLTTGDSMTQGAGGNNSYPNQLAGLMMADTVVRSYGVSSQNLANIISIEPTRADLDRNTLLYSENVLVAWVGLVDLFTGASAAATYALYVQYCEERIAAGWDKVIACTVTPSSKPGIFGDYETRRQDFNDLVRTNYLSFSHGCADMGGHPVIGAPGAELNTIYYFDLLHMTAAGYQIVAGLVEGAI